MLNLIMVIIAVIFFFASWITSSKIVKNEEKQLSIFKLKELISSQVGVHKKNYKANLFLHYLIQEVGNEYKKGKVWKHIKKIIISFSLVSYLFFLMKSLKYISINIIEETTIGYLFNIEQTNPNFIETIILFVKLDELSLLLVTVFFLIGLKYSQFKLTSIFEQIKMIIISYFEVVISLGVCYIYLKKWLIKINLAVVLSASVYFFIVADLVKTLLK